MEFQKEFQLSENSIKHPCSWTISGCSQAGKTYYTMKIIENVDQIFNTVFSKIQIYYTEDQPSYNEMQMMDNRVELISNNEISEPPAHSLIIFDDQMNSNMRDQKVSDLFTKGVHHKQVSAIILTQNLFPKGLFARDIRLNTHYITIMKSPLFKSQVMHLGRQVFPEHPKFLYDAYKQATESSYGNLCLDLHPTTHDGLRVMSGVLPHEEEKVVFTPKK
jgi:hypothetical protein